MLVASRRDTENAELACYGWVLELGRDLQTRVAGEDEMRPGNTWAPRRKETRRQLLN